MVKILRKIARFMHYHKTYIEVITAILTIPVLLTVIFLNINNITNKDKDELKDSGQPTIIIENKTSPVPEEKTENNNSSNNSPCKKEIGPLSISYPKEGATISDNPLNFNIKYDDESYCKVVWSYRINDALWSQYGSNAPVVYNLDSGNIKFELRVQSTVTDEEDVLSRSFIYENTRNTSEIPPEN